MPKKISYGGTEHTFPDDFSDDDISNALAGWDQSHGQVDLHAQNRDIMAPAINKLSRTTNSRAGGMGYGETVADTHPVAEGDRGVLPALKRVGSGIAHLPGQLLDPENKDEYETAIDSGTSLIPGMGRAAKALKRAFIDPSREAAKKRDYYDLVTAAKPEQADEPTAGSAHMSRMWQMATAVPVIGPMAGSLTERAVTGDPTGAGAEAAALVATPKVMEKAGGLAKKAAGKALYPMADRMMKTPTGTGDINPVDAFTPHEIKSFAEDVSHGPAVEMTPAEITEHGGLRAVQGIGQKSLFGKGRLQEHQANAQSAVIGRTRNLMNKINPNAGTSLQIGRELYSQATDAAKRAKDAANVKYAEWRQNIPGGVDVDLTPLQEKYGNLLDTNTDVFDNIPTEQASKLKAGMTKAKEFGVKVKDEDGNVSINPTMDLEAVREMRSHWLDSLRELKRKGRADSKEAALYADIVHDLDGGIEQSLRRHGAAASGGTAEEQAAAGEALVGGWRDANSAWKQYVEDFHGDDSALADILDTPQTELVKLPGRVLERGTGGNPVHIDQLRRHGVKLGGLQRDVVDRALNSGFRTTQNKLAGFDDEFLQHVFAENPGDLESLYKNARIGRSIGVDYNPSNTAGAMAGRSEFEAPFKAGASMLTGEPKSAAMELLDAGPGWAASRLSTSKLFKNWMTRTPDTTFGRWLLGKKKPGGGGTGTVSPTPGPTNTPGGGGGGSVPPTGSGPVPGSSRLTKSEPLSAEEHAAIDQEMEGKVLADDPAFAEKLANHRQANKLVKTETEANTRRAGMKLVKGGEDDLEAIRRGANPGGEVEDTSVGQNMVPKEQRASSRMVKEDSAKIGDRIGGHQEAKAKLEKEGVVAEGKVTEAHAAGENGYYEKAKAELGADAGVREVLARAQELKSAAAAGGGKVKGLTGGQGRGILEREGKPGPSGNGAGSGASMMKKASKPEDQIEKIYQKAMDSRDSSPTQPTAEQEQAYTDAYMDAYHNTKDVDAFKKATDNYLGRALEREGEYGQEGDTGFGFGANKMKKTRSSNPKKTKLEKPLMQQLSEGADVDSINKEMTNMAADRIEKGDNPYDMLDMIPKPTKASQSIMKKHGYKQDNEGGLSWSNKQGDTLSFSASGKFFDHTIRDSDGAPIYNEQGGLADYLKDKHGEPKASRKLKKGPKGDGPEGPARSGTGPGAMLRKGSELGVNVDAGPMSGVGPHGQKPTQSSRLWDKTTRVGVALQHPETYDMPDLSWTEQHGVPNNIAEQLSRVKRKLKLVDKKGPKGDGPEGPAKPGTGPGAMLRRGSTLGLEMKSGPHTGEGQTLYHGTQEPFLNSILEEGIKPVGQLIDEGEWRPEDVQLKRDSPGRYNSYLTKSSDVAGWFSDGPIVEVEVPKSAIRTTTKHPEDVTYPGLTAQKTGEYRAVNAGGRIPPELIKGVRRLKKKEE